MQFVQKILPLIKEVELRYNANEDNPKSLFRHMTEMLASKTKKLAIYEDELYNLSKFNKQYPGFIDSVQLINVSVVYTEIVLDLSLELKWLITPRKDGKPKMLEIYAEFPLSRIMKMGMLMDCVKEVRIE